MKSEWPLGSLGLYLHIPFCRQKCSYCDFYSVPGASLEQLAAYVECLCAEIAAISSIDRAVPVDSIYFGGGTPSLLQSAQIGLLLDAIASRFSLTGDAEITMEVNPATVDGKAWPAYKHAGINRISLGLQSLHNNELAVLGRIHSARTARETILALSAAGFDNISFDLIYGIPGQTMAAWMQTLREAAGYSPQHVSMYLLQLDAHVPLAESIVCGKLALPGEEIIETMYYQGIDYLQQQGLVQYEISNLASPGYACRHNLRYWQCGEYLGIGAAAVSCRGGRRWMNAADLQVYMSGGSQAPQVILEDMDPRQQAAEAIILGLRLRKGINIEAFSRRFGFDIMQHHQELVQRLISSRLLELEHGWLRLTKRGFLLSNQVLCHFVA